MNIDIKKEFIIEAVRKIEKSNYNIPKSSKYGNGDTSDKIIKFEEHFHGWSDAASATGGADENWEYGIPSQVLDTMIVIPPNDISILESLLDKLSNSSVSLSSLKKPNIRILLLNVLID